MVIVGLRVSADRVGVDVEREIIVAYLYGGFGWEGEVQCNKAGRFGIVG